MKRLFFLTIIATLVCSLFDPSLVVAAPEAQLTSALIPSEIPSTSCHNRYDPDIQEAIRKDVAAYAATIIKEWRRQVGFRVRATPNASSKRIRQSRLNQSEQTLSHSLTTLKATFETHTASDIGLLDDLLGAKTMNEAAVLTWSARHPSFFEIDATLDQLQRDLLRYANTTDKKIIIRVWAEKRKAFHDDLLQRLTENRQLFLENLRLCSLSPTP